MDGLLKHFLAIFGQITTSLLPVDYVRLYIEDSELETSLPTIKWTERETKIHGQKNKW